MNNAMNRGDEFLNKLRALFDKGEALRKLNSLIEEYRELFSNTPLEQYLIRQERERERFAEVKHAANIQAFEHAVQPFLTGLLGVAAGYVAKKSGETPSAPTAANTSGTAPADPEAAFNEWVASFGMLLLGLSPEAKHDFLFTVLEHSGDLPNQTSESQLASFRMCLMKIRNEVGAVTFDKMVAKPGRELFARWVVG